MALSFPPLLMKNVSMIQALPAGNRNIFLSSLFYHQSYLDNDSVSNLRKYNNFSDKYNLAHLTISCNFRHTNSHNASKFSSNFFFNSNSRLVVGSLPSVLNGNSSTGISRNESDAIFGIENSPVIVIDNYDSFTYNLCQYLGDLGCKYSVYRNDDITIEELEKLNPRGILISPGPGTPNDSGISLDVVMKFKSTIPLFGVCMGHQCIGQAFGGRIIRAPGGVMHGKTSLVYHNESHDGLMAGLPNPFVACRYHSLVIEKETFPHAELEITAWTEDGLVMGVRHRKFHHLEGVQFHPESIITKNGINIVKNFIEGLDIHAEKIRNWNTEQAIQKS